ncbi:hypothetical protein HYS99_00365 [Candidatus Giovannonibacteria bacterium]|nr:hypothetical protein [Candidatus Giovannonibacteria bacterium]
MRKWEKWSPLAVALQVGLESTLPAGTAAEFLGSVPPVEELEKTEMIYRAREPKKGVLGLEIEAAMGQVSKETVDRHYHPRVKCADFNRPIRTVVFDRHITGALFERLCLRRHGERKAPPPRMWCGRFGEEDVFGFNAKRSKNPHYVTLAYPGLTPDFVPLYIKVMESGLNAPYYLRVDVHDEPGKKKIRVGKAGEERSVSERIVVEVRQVNSKDVPAFLREQY